MSNDRPMQVALVVAAVLTIFGLWAILARQPGVLPCDCSECVGEEYDLVGPKPQVSKPHWYRRVEYGRTI